jgi:ATP-binding cassette subfamily B protein/subfamily B ATP-binding cassette protein MsbA
LLSAIARLVELDQGEIRIDGQRITEHSTASLRRIVSMLSPDLPLQRGTIRSNLCYRWPDAPPSELARVIRVCGIDEIARALPKGIDSRIQEGGNNLSLGQRQRIALGRAIIGNPPVLLLDEADSNLDPRASHILDRVLEHYPGTVLIVTHRREWAARADKLWYLANGRLIETGSPATMLNRPGPAHLLFQQRLRSAS